MNEKIVEAIKEFLLPELKDIRLEIIKLDTKIERMQGEFSGL